MEGKSLELEFEVSANNLSKVEGQQGVDADAWFSETSLGGMT